MSPRSASPVMRLYVLSLRELWRNRIGLLLLVLIPPVFLAVVEGTSGAGTLPVQLHGGAGTTTLLLSQHDISVVFVGAAVSGFLTAYYAILLFQVGLPYYRQCIGMGLSTRDFAVARFLFFLTVVVGMAIYIALLTALMVPLENPIGALLGFILIGAIYGGYGGLVGLLTKDFLGAVLFVAALANLDAGWLQNPIFYSASGDTTLIRWLPAFHPTQVIFDAAFTGGWNARGLALGTCYAALFWIAMYVALRVQVRSICRWWEAR